MAIYCKRQAVGGIVFYKHSSSYHYFYQQMKYLSFSDEEPADTDWEDVPLVSFQLPDCKLPQMLFRQSKSLVRNLYQLSKMI